MLRLIGNFVTTQVERLSSQLAQFEANVDAETRAIRAGFMPELEQRFFTSTSSQTGTLLPGQVAICDATLSSFTLSLSVTAKLAPGLLAVVKKTATNTVAVAPSGQSAPGVARTINAATNFACNAAGLYLFYFDGLNWWKAI